MTVALICCSGLWLLQLHATALNSVSLTMSAGMGGLGGAGCSWVVWWFIWEPLFPASPSLEPSGGLALGTVVFWKCHVLGTRGCSLLSLSYLRSGDENSL